MRGSSAAAPASAPAAGRSVVAVTSRMIAAEDSEAPGASRAAYIMKGTWSSVLDWSTMFSGMR